MAGRDSSPQSSGQAVKQAGAGRVLGQFALDLHQFMLEGFLLAQTAVDHVCQLIGESPAAGAEEHVGGAPFPLQLMDQVANTEHQLTHLKEAFQVSEFTSLRGNQVIGGAGPLMGVR